MRASVALFVALATVQQATAVTDKWTPEHFNWSRVPSYENALYQNVSASTPSKELVVYAANRHAINSTDVVAVEHLAIAAAIGWAVSKPVSFAVGAASIAGVANGCLAAFQQPSFRNGFFCMLGLGATIGGFGCLSLSPV